MIGRQRGQAVVEIVILAPIIAACVGAFAIAALRIAAVARVESALQVAIAADAAGEPVASALHGRARLVEIRPDRIVVSVSAPWGAIRGVTQRVRP